MPVDMPNIEQRVSKMGLEDHTSAAPVTTSCWHDERAKTEHFKTIKELAFGYCRLLYGSERFKFYDIIVLDEKDSKNFFAVLTCNQSDATKILRQSEADCALKAVSAMVAGLQKDTVLLFKDKYTVGSELRGQQGFTNQKTGQWELSQDKFDHAKSGPQDDTAGIGSRAGFKRNFGDSYVSAHAPTGPRGDREAVKKPRMDDRMATVEAEPASGSLVDHY